MWKTEAEESERDVGERLDWPSLALKMEVEAISINAVNSKSWKGRENGFSPL